MKAAEGARRSNRPFGFRLSIIRRELPAGVPVPPCWSNSERQSANREGRRSRLCRRMKLQTLSCGTREESRDPSSPSRTAREGVVWKTKPCAAFASALCSLLFFFLYPVASMHESNTISLIYMHTIPRVVSPLTLAAAIANKLTGIQTARLLLHRGEMTRTCMVFGLSRPRSPLLRDISAARARRLSDKASQRQSRFKALSQMSSGTARWRPRPDSRESGPKQAMRDDGKPHTQARTRTPLHQPTRQTRCCGRRSSEGSQTRLRL